MAEAKNKRKRVRNNIQIVAEWRTNKLVSQFNSIVGLLSKGASEKTQVAVTQLLGSIFGQLQGKASEKSQTALIAQLSSLNGILTNVSTRSEQLSIVQLLNSLIGVSSHNATKAGQTSILEALNSLIGASQSTADKPSQLSIIQVLSSINGLVSGGADKKTQLALCEVLTTIQGTVSGSSTQLNQIAIILKLCSIEGLLTLSLNNNKTKSSVPSTVAANTTDDTELLPENLKRKGATIYNDGNKIMYLLLGSGASNSVFTYKILSNGYFEVPFGYVGRISGKWDLANGNARITEFE